jgi:hypothetical protein
VAQSSFVSSRLEVGIAGRDAIVGTVVPFWNWRKFVQRPADEMQLGSNVEIASKR